MATKSQREKRRKDRLALLCETTPQSFQLECDLPVEFQAAAGEGKLPTFTMTAYTGGRMMPRGFSTPVVADLMSLKILAGPRPIFMNHDPNKIVGHATVEVQGRAIKVIDGVISGAGAAAEEVRLSASRGFPWKASIGGNPERLDFVEAGKQVEINGQKFNGPVIVARGVLVHEVSFVPLAGDNRTSATVAASFNSGDSPMTFEQWLQASGFDIATLTDGQKTKLRAAFDAEMKLAAGAAGGGNPTPPNGNSTPANPTPAPIAAHGTGGSEEDDDPIKERRRLEAAEATRIDAIHAMFAKPEFAAALTLKVKTSAGETPLKAHAIAEGWTADATELYALRNSRPAPAGHSRSHDTDCTMQALQGAMMLRAGIALDSPVFAGEGALALRIPQWIRAGLNTDNRQRSMEAAWRYRGKSMFDLSIEAMRLDGKDVPSSGDRSEIIQASFSGTSLSAVFTTTVNAKLLVSYQEAPDTTTGWTQEEDVPDFRLNERPRVTTGQGLTKLPPGQTADHVTFSDVYEQYKIARYARQFVVDEQDVIGDRFNVIKDTPEKFGQAARRLRPDLVYYILLSNPTLNATGLALFHATHSNLNTGAAFAEPTLKASIADFMLLQENSVNLDLKLTHLLMPPTLKHAAAVLISSAEMITGSDTTRGNRNTIQDENLQLVSDSRLENGVTDPDSGNTASGSASTWFGASTMANTIVVGYLNGTGRVPRVRSFNLQQGQYGIGFDVSMDIGAKGMDFRGLQKNTA